MSQHLRRTPVELAQLLAALPSKQSTRISIARMIGELMISEGTAADRRAGEYRVSAYGFEPRGLRWEVSDGHSALAQGRRSISGAAPKVELPQGYAKVLGS